MSENIHEPKFVTNAKNGIAYFVLAAVMSIGIIILLAGMVSFLFIPWAMKRAKTLAYEETWKTFEIRHVFYRTVMGVVLTLWFLLSWGFIYVSYRNGL